MNIDTQIKNRGTPLFFIGFMSGDTASASQTHTPLPCGNKVSLERSENDILSQ